MAGRIRDGIKSYLVATELTGASAVQLQETRRAFYAGAQHVLSILWELGADDVPEEDGARVMEELSRECKNFAIDVQRGRA